MKVSKVKSNQMNTYNLYQYLYFMILKILLFNMILSSYIQYQTLRNNISRATYTGDSIDIEFVF